MTLKRKRSLSSFSFSSSPTTSTTTGGTPSPSNSPEGLLLPSFFPTSKPQTWPPIPPPPAILTRTKGPTLSATDLGSRTRKRHRDDRPEVGDVHRSTLLKLWEAQRRDHVSPPASPGFEEEEEGGEMEWWREGERAEDHGEVAGNVAGMREDGVLGREQRGQRRLEDFFFGRMGGGGRGVEVGRRGDGVGERGEDVEMG